jgi:hypothetical protein
MRQPFQNVYIRLCADANLRAAWRADPAGALAPWGLTAREQAALEALDAEALERFAGSLLSKREDELRPHVRLTASVCPDITARYRRWLSDHPSPIHDGLHPPGLAEALRALAPLRASLRTDPSLAPYAADVFAFEVQAAASRLDQQPRSMRAPYHLPEVMADLRQGVLPIDPPDGRVEIQFLSSGPRWRPW